MGLMVREISNIAFKLKNSLKIFFLSLKIFFLYALSKYLYSAVNMSPLVNGHHVDTACGEPDSAGHCSGLTMPMCTHPLSRIDPWLSTGPRLSLLLLPGPGLVISIRAAELRLVITTLW